jgi:hypothetical protein
MVKTRTLHKNREGMRRRAGLINSISGYGILPRYALVRFQRKHQFLA